MGNNSSRAKAYLEDDVEERNTSTPSPPADADPLADLKQQRRQQRDASPGAPTTKQWHPDSGPVLTEADSRASNVRRVSEKIDATWVALPDGSFAVGAASSDEDDDDDDAAADDDDTIYEESTAAPPPPLPPAAADPSPTPAPPTPAATSERLHEGWLQRRNPNGRGWAWRFVVLHRHALALYVSEEAAVAAQPKALVPLVLIKGITRKDGRRLALTTATASGSTRPYEIAAAAGRQAAPPERVCAEWLQQLQHAHGEQRRRDDARRAALDAQAARADAAANAAKIEVMSLGRQPSLLEQLRADGAADRAAAAAAAAASGRGRADARVRGAWWRAKEAAALWEAAAAGDARTVKEMLRRGASVDGQRPSDGKSALMLACEGGGHDVVQALVDDGCARLHLDSDDGQTALHYACRRLGEALDYYSVATGTSADGLAADAAELRTLRCLLRAGAPSTCTDHQGRTPFAVSGCETVGAVRRLFDSAADAVAADGGGSPAAARPSSPPKKKPPVARHQTPRLLKPSFGGASTFGDERSEVSAAL